MRRIQLIPDRLLSETLVQNNWIPVLEELPEGQFDRHSPVAPTFRAIRAFENKLKQEQPEHYLYCSGEIVIDFAERTVWIEGRRQALYRCDLALLQALLFCPHRLVSRQALAEIVSRDGHVLMLDNSLSACVSRLRRKLDPLDLRAYIETVPGTGYYWRPSVLRRRRELSGPAWLYSQENEAPGSSAKKYLC